MGSILGGFAESASLLVGFQYLLVVAGAIYLASWVVAPRAAKPLPLRQIFRGP
jgi:hypothetical protein